MLVLVYFFVPETKGRTLESMDEVFGSAYAGLGDVELRSYRRERGIFTNGGAGKDEEEGGKGKGKGTEVGAEM